MDNVKKIVIDGVEYDLRESPVVEPPVVEPPVEATPAFSGAKPWWSFVKAPRFWVMIGGALSIYFETKGWIGEPERNLIATVSAIFVTVATLDRGAEKMAGK
jgi:hypothetical protein